MKDRDVMVLKDRKGYKFSLACVSFSVCVVCASVGANGLFRIVPLRTAESRSRLRVPKRRCDSCRVRQRRIGHRSSFARQLEGLAQLNVGTFDVVATVESRQQRTGLDGRIQFVCLDARLICFYIQIPLEIGLLSQLTLLSISNARLKGALPNGFGCVQNLL